MIGMKMGEQNRIDLRCRNFGLRKLRPGSLADIDEDHMTAGDDRGAGIGPLGVEDWRACAAKQDVQRVVLVRGCLVRLGNLPDHGALDEGILHRRHEPDDRKGGEDGRNQHAEGNGKSSHDTCLLSRFRRLYTVAPATAP